jgi:branched-chain amino acid transport system ATP-binding protein
MTKLLQINNLCAYYGKSQALFNVNLDIDSGEIVTILGKNGMGKSSTVKSIVGVIPYRKGEIHFEGQPIDKLNTDIIARRGISVVPEGRQIFPNLTVEENLFAFSRNSVGRLTPWNLKEIYSLFPRLYERRSNMGNQLSGGEQQMLAISRALMANPKLLIIDEATEGLAPIIREEIWSCLKRLKDNGQAIIVIDKYVERLIPIANRHFILGNGKVVWHGTSEQLDSDHQIWKQHLSV